MFTPFFHAPALLALLLATTTTFTHAQSSSDVNEIVYPTTAASSAIPLATSSGYEYVGCYNETVGFEEAGGVRAVQDGIDQAMNDLTVEKCLDYCAERGSFQYAAVEYGRECYCGFLSTLSEEVDEELCNFACNGNDSQVCGGQLRLSLYNRTVEEQVRQGSAWSVVSNAGGAAWYGTAAVLTLVLAAAL